MFTRPIDFGTTSPKKRVSAKGTPTLRSQFDDSPNSDAVTFCTKIFTAILIMITVTRRSRGDESRSATSRFRGSRSVLKALTFRLESENKEVSEAEKKPEKNNRITSRLINIVIISNRRENKLSPDLRAPSLDYALRPFQPVLCQILVDGRVIQALVPG